MHVCASENIRIELITVFGLRNAAFTVCKPIEIELQYFSVKKINIPCLGFSASCRS